MDLQAKMARYPFVSARLDRAGYILETCDHQHGRYDAAAINCARERGWNGFVEMLVAGNAAARPLETWRFWSERGTTYLRSLR